MKIKLSLIAFIILLFLFIFSLIPINLPEIKHKPSFFSFIEKEKAGVQFEFVYTKKIGNITEANVNLYYESNEYGEIKINGFLFYQENKKLPAILVFHGFGGNAKSLKELAFKLSKKEYVTFVISSPGQGNSTGPKNTRENFANITSGIESVYLYQNVLAGIRAIDFLVNLDFVDKEKIAVTGTSQGGVTTLLLTSIDKRIKLAIPIVGVGGFLDAVLSGGFANAIITSKVTANSKEGITLLENADPLVYIDNIDVPTLIIIGTNDEFFPLISINKTYNKLNEKIRYISLTPNTPHSGPGEKIWFDLVVSWLDFHFKNKGDIPFIYDLKIEEKIANIRINFKANNEKEVKIAYNLNYPWSKWNVLEVKKLKDEYSLNLPLSPFGIKFFIIVKGNGIIITTPYYERYSNFLFIIFILIHIFIFFILFFLFSIKKTKIEKKYKKFEYLFLFSASFFPISTLLPFVEVFQRIKVNIWQLIYHYSFYLNPLIPILIYLIFIVVPYLALINKKITYIYSWIVLILTFLFFILSFIFLTLIYDIVILIPSSMIFLLFLSLFLMRYSYINLKKFF